MKSGRESFPFVAEASVGDAEAAEERLAILRPLPLLDVSDAVLPLAAAILQSGYIPAKAARDAAHIAVSAVHRIDFLLTWNCAHIANAQNCQEGSRDLRAAGISVPGDLHAGRVDGELNIDCRSNRGRSYAIREQLAAKFDFDIRKIVADAQQRQAFSQARAVSFETPNHRQQPTGAAMPVSSETPSPAAPAAER